MAYFIFVGEKTIFLSCPEIISFDQKNWLFDLHD
jgi:hypothetical protein